MAKISVLNIERLVNEGIVRYSHTSYFRGYVSRVKGTIVGNYKGKFGEGYQVLKPNWQSTRYSFVTYYIFT